MKIFGFTIMRLCGGAYLKGKALRRVHGGVVSDWAGVGMWWTR